MTNYLFQLIFNDLIREAVQVVVKVMEKFQTHKQSSHDSTSNRGKSHAEWTVNLP